MKIIRTILTPVNAMIKRTISMSKRVQPMDDDELFIEKLQSDFTQSTREHEEWIKNFNVEFEAMQVEHDKRMKEVKAFFEERAL